MSQSPQTSQVPVTGDEIGANPKDRRQNLTFWVLVTVAVLIGIGLVTYLLGLLPFASEHHPAHSDLHGGLLGELTRSLLRAILFALGFGFTGYYLLQWGEKEADK